MSIIKKTIFISDLHLEANRPDISRCFCEFLQNCPPEVDAIYILGDLFESWIGDDDVTPFTDAIIAALAQATKKGLPIYFMHGNRDFLIGNTFLRKTGCRLIKDATVIRLYTKPVVIMHGDTLCTRDVAYIKARRWLRNKVLQTLFLCLPLFLRKKYAEKIRLRSMQHTSSTDTDIMDVTQEEVVRVMQENQVMQLIHGHTHRPGIHEFTLNQQPATRIVLGAWHAAGSVLVWDENGNKELQTLSFK